MRILFLADINSSHTQRWVNGLTTHGLQVGIFSFTVPKDAWYKSLNIACYHPVAKLTKWKYVFQLSSLRKAIRTFQPDILHAHYATSYGLLARLSGFQPFVISAVS